MGRDDRDDRRIDKGRDQDRDRRRDRSTERKGGKDNYSKNWDQRKDNAYADKYKGKKYDRNERGHSGKYDRKNVNDRRNKRSRSRSKDRYQKKEPVKLSATFVHDELEKWKALKNEANLLETELTIPNFEVSKALEDFINKENNELDAISEEDLLDVKNKEDKKIEEARARRKALMEKLNQGALTSHEKLKSPTIQSQLGPLESDDIEHIEDIENDLENMADFVVHDQHGTILEPAKPEPNDHDHSRGVTKKVYDMFEDSGSSEDYEAKNEDRPKDRHLDFDDDEQYYRAQVGEIFHESFKVIAIMGKGVYGSVVKAQEISTDRMVAVKVERGLT